MSTRIIRPNRRGFVGLAGSAAAFLSCGCVSAFAEQSTEKGDPIAGDKKSLKSHALELGADLLQDDSPISVINMYLNGFHFYADDMGRQVEAHHYCTHINEDFFQCVIYDGNKAGSRLIGIEYIVSERLFKTLPEKEKPLWHSHRHETTSGELIMPGIPETVEHTAIAPLVSTYGKTWHTWQIDESSSIPLGIPQLMMGFTADGQLDAGMLRKRDTQLETNTASLKRTRADLAQAAPPPDPSADGWKNGTSYRLALEEVPLKNKR